MYVSIYGVKSRILGSKILDDMFGRTKIAPFSELMAVIYQWQLQDIGRLEMRLKAMALFPFFLAARPPQGKFYDINASPMIECLRVLTNSISVRSCQFDNDPGWVWVEGSESKLLLSIVTSHLTSLFDSGSSAEEDSSTQEVLKTSWSGVSTACGLYMYSVLGLWKTGEPTECRIFRRIIVMLARDVHQTRNEPKDSISSCFWFWKAFVGAYSLARRQLYLYDESLKPLEDCFAGLIRNWSRDANVSRWEEARVRLMRITWSTSFSQFQAQRVWERAVQEPEAVIPEDL